MAAPMITIERIYPAPVEALWDLWTTKAGFESWWGPQGFRVDVHRIEPRLGGALVYDMLAATPEMEAAMAELGRPPSHETRGSFTEYQPFERLVLTHVIDFLPGVAAYDSTIAVAFAPLAGGRARMAVTLHAMHDAATSAMQAEGFTSQLSKLDQRFGWQAQGAGR